MSMTVEHVAHPFVDRAYASRHLPRSQGLDWIDLALIAVFFAGIYTNYPIPVSKTVPFPSAPAGVAGVLLLWRRRADIRQAGLIGLLVVLAIYVISVLLPPNLGFLPRRMNGLVQLSYSLIIGYALFATIIKGTRAQIARLFLACSLVLLVGCLLETYGGLRPVSDAARRVLYHRGFYESDLRDLQYYARIRPKFFASEPSSVTFCYTLFTFLWLVVSSRRWKLPVYAGLTAAGLLAMPGPTLLLMVVLVAPYLLLLASRRDGRIDLGRALPLALICLSCGALVLVLATTVFSQRHRDAASGDDPSAFYRVRGPALAGVHVLKNYPLSGTGLTGRALRPGRNHGAVRPFARLFGPLADRAAVIGAAYQLFLAALDISRRPDGCAGGRGGYHLAGDDRCAKSGVRLGGVGDHGPGFGCLCGANLLGRPVPCRCGGAVASASRKLERNPIS